MFQLKEYSLSYSIPLLHLCWFRVPLLNPGVLSNLGLFHDHDTNVDDDGVNDNSDDDDMYSGN